MCGQRGTYMTILPGLGLTTHQHQNEWLLTSWVDTAQHFRSDGMLEGIGQAVNEETHSLD